MNIGYTVKNSYCIVNRIILINILKLKGGARVANDLALSLAMIMTGLFVLGLVIAVKVIIALWSRGNEKDD